MEEPDKSRKKKMPQENHQQDEGRYKRPECNRGFKHQSNMNRHRLIHWDKQKQSIKCTECDANEISNLGNIRRHFRNLHPGKIVKYIVTETPI